MVSEDTDGSSWLQAGVLITWQWQPGKGALGRAGGRLPGPSITSGCRRLGVQPPESGGVHSGLSLTTGEEGPSIPALPPDSPPLVLPWVALLLPTFTLCMGEPGVGERGGLHSRGEAEACVGQGLSKGKCAEQPGHLPAAVKGTWLRRPWLGVGVGTLSSAGPLALGSQEQLQAVGLAAPRL